MIYFQPEVHPVKIGCLRPLAIRLHMIMQFLPQHCLLVIAMDNNTAKKTCTSLTQHWNSKFHLTQTSAVQDVTINSWKAITNFTSSTVEQWNGEGGCNESLDRSVLDGTLFDLCTEGTKNVILRSGSVRRGVILRATVEGKLQSAMRSHI